METDHERPEIARLLASFNSLPEQDRETALQLIHQKGSIRTDLQQPHSTESPGTEGSASTRAHSCSFCKKFGLTPESRYVDGETHVYTTKQLSFTKEQLIQGLGRQCLLIQWVFSLLARSLTNLKSELARKGQAGSKISGYDTLQVAAGDLEHLETETGISILFEVYNGAEEGVFHLTYEVDRALLDRLWSISHEVQIQMSYTGFEYKYRGDAMMSLKVHTAADDPAASDIAHRPAKQYLDSEAYVDIARQWLTECHDTHEECSKHTGLLPSRVLDIGTRSPVRTVKLHWPEEGERGQYVALSYCWGGQQPITTTTKTAQAFTDGLPSSMIPKTILDAIWLTSKLGIRYLWVDCLCIIQDDPEDVAREIAKMSEIFQEAYVTFSAARARSVHEGFLSPQQWIVEPSIRLPFQTSNSDMGSVLLEQPQSYSRAEDPIHLRAWTLQEHILSRRMLLFGTKGLLWTCETKSYHEGDGYRDIGDLFHIRGDSTIARATLEHWRSIVCDYSRRFLTYSNDKLPGIAGVAAEYSRLFGGAYLAGLWEFALSSELMWCSNRPDITRPLVQRAPSWSWASVDGEVHHKWCSSDLGISTLKIVGCHVTPVSTSSPFGSVDPSRSSLLVEGDMIEVWWSPDRKRIFLQDPELTLKVRKSDIGRTQADAPDNLPSSSMVWALVVTQNPPRGLLLAHIEGNTFRRVGIFYRMWDDNFFTFKRRVVSII